jgi:hypothetical protein
LKSSQTPKDIDTPKTWRQLIKSPNKHWWLKAAEEEYASLIGMGKWKLVCRPAKQKIIKSKWVFKVKRQADKTIQKLKGQLVAMGYSQVQGVDYKEVFAPTIRLETLCLILTLLAAKKWSGRQVDFKTAFLNGHLDEPVYMAQPPGFKDPTHPDWVCKVTRSIYGLKQSPQEWNRKLHASLVSIGLTQSKYDPTLYFKLDQCLLIGALTTHVDNLAIFGEELFVQDTISQLGKHFKIGADEELHHFLSLNIQRELDENLVYLSQEHYITDLCARFLDGEHTPTLTPTDSHFKDLRCRTATDPVSSGPYNQLIGSLNAPARTLRLQSTTYLSSSRTRQNLTGKQGYTF